jgi:hypothetical protein
MLEFYPDHRPPFPSLILRPSAAWCALSLRRVLLVAFALTIGSCAQIVTSPPGRGQDGADGPARSTAPPIAPNVEPPPPPVNLSGFPLPYRQGYADGCASAAGPERRDATRFSADGNYRTGWQDGLALCRKK